VTPRIRGRKMIDGKKGQITAGHDCLATLTIQLDSWTLSDGSDKISRDIPQSVNEDDGCT
jgi:hypothetical protein